MYVSMYSQTCKKPTLKVEKWLSETKDNFHVNIFDIVTAVNQKNVHESLRCYFSSAWRWMILICGLQRTNIDIGKKMYPQPMLGWFFTDLRSKCQSTRDRCYFLLFFETSFLCNLRAVKKEKKPYMHCSTWIFQWYIFVVLELAAWESAIDWWCRKPVALKIFFLVYPVAIT